MQETWVLFLGWEAPLEKEKATHSSIQAWENPMDRGALVSYCRVARSRTQLSNFQFHIKPGQTLEIISETAQLWL